MILFIPNFLIDTRNLYFAFNWNPKVKPKKIFWYYRGDDFIVIDIWKFRILRTDMTLKVETK